MPTKKRRNPERLVKIGITPPELVPRSAAGRLNTQLSDPSTRPTPREIAKLPWLSQERANRAGYHLVTEGLRRNARHPELELCNVPGVLLADASNLLVHLADYVLNDSAVHAGEVLMVGEEALSVVSFRDVAPKQAGTAQKEPVLRVLFLR